MIESVGHYRILDRIGAGGMGEVYRARDTRLGRTVAVKLLPAAVAEDPERRERFLREARATSALSHPNIATLFEIGEQDGRLYLVFEYVPGQTLRALIGDRPINPRRALEIAAQVADALADAHAAGIIHRDIKPDNIIVTPKGPAKVLDFGLATWTTGGAMREAGATALETRPGLFVGTVAYMSPEQARGEPVDHRTDLFSLGVVLYEMLTGKSPFAAASPTATRLQVVQTEPPMPSTVNARIPMDVDTVVSGMLAKPLLLRYQDAVHVAATLREIAARLDERQARQAAAAPVAMPSRARRRIRVMPVVAIGLLIAIIWVLREQGRALWSRTFGSPPPPVLAVMPLEPVEQASETYFADGLTDDLITRIGQIPGVRVLGRSATRAYRGKNPQAIAHELGAAVVLTGSVRRQVEQMRVTVALIDPATGIELWSEQFTRPLRDVFAVQNEIAEQVARKLRVTLAPSEARARTASRLVDARAYDVYLRAREATARRDLTKAIELYEEAVRTDPTLVEAQAGLVEALYLDRIFFGRFDDADGWARIRAAAATAVAADPDLPQAQLAMALAAPTLKEALGHLRRATERDPSFAEAYHQAGDQVVDFDPQRALGFYRNCLEVDPRYDITYLDMSTAWLALDRLAEAGRVLDDAEAKFPGRPWWPAGRSRIEWRRGRPAAALALLEPAAKVLPAPVIRSITLRLLVDAGRAEQARELVREADAAGQSGCETRALAAALAFDRGDTAAARRDVEAMLAGARRPDAPRALYRCAAIAAAAVGNGAEAAIWITRTAGDDEALRVWTLQAPVASALTALALRWYPWNKVAASPQVVAAERELERARAATRREIEAVLGERR